MRSRGFLDFFSIQTQGSIRYVSKQHVVVVVVVVVIVVVVVVRCRCFSYFALKSCRKKIATSCTFFIQHSLTFIDQISHTFVAPGNLEVFLELLSDTTIRVSWKLGRKNDVIQAYYVTYTRADDPEDTKTIKTTNASEVVTDLKPGKTYSFVVSSF